MEITAVIVARKGSERVPSKSLLKIDGLSLIARKICQLKECKKISRIILGSDSDEMLEEGIKYGAEIVRRPDYYCDEKVASANEMIQNMCSLIETDIICWTHCTNPLVSSQTYDKAISAFLNNTEYDSLLSVVELKEHLWKDGKPFNYNPYAKRHVPARELPPLYMQDGAIFIQYHKNMLENSYFFGKKPFLFTIPNEEFLDINDYKDYVIAKYLIENLNKLKLDTKN